MPSTVGNSAARGFPTIKHVRTFITQGPGSGGDYHNVHGGHWLIDSKISTPMSQYEEYRKSRTSWGINVLGSFCVELEASDGTKGFATGFGGPPACWLVAEHFERFLIGKGTPLFPHVAYELSANEPQILGIPTICSSKCTALRCSTAAKDYQSPSYPS